MAAVRRLNARAMREGAISVSTVGGRGGLGGGGALPHVGDVRRRRVRWRVEPMPEG